MDVLFFLSFFGAMFGWILLIFCAMGLHDMRGSLRTFRKNSQKDPECAAWYAQQIPKARALVFVFSALTICSAIFFFGGILLQMSFVGDPSGKYAVRSGVDGPIEIVTDAPFLVFPWEDKIINHYYDEVRVESVREFEHEHYFTPTYALVRVNRTATTVSVWVDGTVRDEQKFLAHIHWGRKRPWDARSPIEKALEAELNQFILEHWAEINWCVEMATYCNAQYDRDAELLQYARPYFEKFGIEVERARISFSDHPIYYY